MSRRYNQLGQLAALTGPQRLRPRPPWMPQAPPVQSEGRNTHLGHTGEDHQWLNYTSQGQPKEEREWQDLNG